MQVAYHELSRCQSMSGTFRKCSRSDLPAPGERGRAPKRRGPHAARDAGAAGARPSVTGRDGNGDGTGARALAGRRTGRRRRAPGSRGGGSSPGARGRGRGSGGPWCPGLRELAQSGVDLSRCPLEERVCTVDPSPDAPPLLAEPGGPPAGSGALVAVPPGRPAGPRSPRAVHACPGPDAGAPRSRTHEGSASRRSPRPAPQGVRRATSSSAARAAAARCRSW